MEGLSSLEGWALIATYFVAMMMLVVFLRKHKKTKEEFLVANRSMPWLLTAFSMAATWVWAPSMFVASEKAYTQGLAGVFWFVVPNVLTLILFAFFANKMRKLRPDGWTFSDYIREKYSKRCHNLYLIESFGLQTMSFAVQLLAGATIFSKITGISFTATTIVMAVCPLLYTFASGIRSSIVTDFWKMLWIVIVLLLGLPIMFSSAGPDALFNGLGGITGDFGSLFSATGIMVALSFGIPTTIGLLSGTFGDQMFWQRVFCVKADKVKRTMITAAFIFAVVPISLAVFGFFAAGTGLAISDTQLTNVGAVMAFCPKWFLYLFFVLILSGLISTVDSIICAVSSVAGHDVVKRLSMNEKWHGRIQKNIFLFILFANEVRAARFAMIVVTIIAILIANIPGLTILYLFLLYGTLRSSVMLPTVFAILGKRMSERGLFYGILTSMIVGLPIFAYGNFTGNIPMIVFGSLFTILASGIMAVRRKPLQRGSMEVAIKIDRTDMDKRIAEIKAVHGEYLACAEKMEAHIRTFRALTESARGTARDIRKSVSQYKRLQGKKSLNRKKSRRK
ncbi:sodium:solute symporter family protein [Bacteroides xylanisolvens]|jgi:Na+/proline symporter|uniref:sodium:solute symporter family protein n=1 Tax=Bacteroides xylanisolvens TaxID=371601 RepID=UPI003AB4061F